MQKVLPARFQEKLLSIGSVELCGQLSRWRTREAAGSSLTLKDKKTSVLQGDNRLNENPAKFNKQQNESTES